MKLLLKYIPVPLTFFLIIGILIGHYFQISSQFIFIWLGILLAALAIIYFKYQARFSIYFSLFFFLITILIGINAVIITNQLNNSKHYSNANQFAFNTQFSLKLKIEKKLKSTSFYDKYVANVIKMNATQTIGKVLLSIEKDTLIAPLTIDDEILSNCQFLPLKSIKNPFGFDYRAYLNHQQIYYQVQLGKKQFQKLYKHSNTIKGYAAIIRNKIIASLLINGFKNEELEVMNALLLGQKTEMSSDLLTSYKNAGAMHILAVSGLHIGILLVLLNFLFKPFEKFKLGKYFTTILIVFLLWMYAVIAGLSPSIVRAVTMFSAVAISMKLNRNSNGFYALITSMFILLLINPFYLFEVGFQFSYLAVFALIWIQPKLDALWKPKFWLVKKIWQIVTVTTAAQLGVLPISLYYFHQFPGLFFITNLVIVPCLGFILGVGIVEIIASLLNQLPSFFADFYIEIIKLLNDFVNWVANQKSFLFQDISYSFILMMLSYLLIVVGVNWFEKRNFKWSFAVLIVIIGLQLNFIVEKYKLQATNEFVVFDLYKSDLVTIRNGAFVKGYASDSRVLHNAALKSYLVGVGRSQKFELAKNTIFLKYKNETILKIDSVEVYDFKWLKPSIVLLQHSPKINLERMIQQWRPNLIIADGSSYPSIIKKWKETCLKAKIPFYNCMQKGAFRLR